MKNRILSLDIFRIFACICVLIVHFNATISGWNNGEFVYSNSIIPNFYFKDVYLGEIGVSIFFIVTGASLYYSYYKNIKEYFTKRFINIYPMFWLTYLLATFIDLIINFNLPLTYIHEVVYSAIGIDGYLFSFGMISGWFYKVGEWFLGCIILIYLVYPVIKYIFDHNSVITSMCFFIVYIVVTEIVYKNISPNFFLVRIPQIIIGMNFIKYRLYLKRNAFLCIGVISLVFAFFFSSNMYNLTKATLICIGLLSLLNYFASLIKQANIVKMIKKISDITYPLFLCHHWISYKLIARIQLDQLSVGRRYSLFFIYMFISCIVAYGIKTIVKRIMTLINNVFIKS